MHSKIKNIAIILLVTFLICAGITIFHLNEQNNTLKNNLKELETKAINTIDKLNNTVSKLKQDNSRLKGELIKLNKSYNLLRKRYTDLNESYNELGRAYESQQSELEKAVSNINLYRYELNQSMQWFKKNSRLETINDPTIKRKLDRNCIDDCSIKLGCLYLVNDQMDYNYKLDEITENAADKLQSLEEFRENEGGDCEDYALFYKAELNHLLKQCGQEVMLESYKKVDNKDKYFLDHKGNWYLEGAEGVKFSGEFHPVVVCGEMYDLNTQKANGHCVIALPQNKIKDIDDLSSLRDAPMIEPQDGSFYGHVGSDVVLKDGPEDGSFISVIITDNDLFLYSQNEQDWMSYGLFSEKLQSLSKELG